MTGRFVYFGTDDGTITRLDLTTNACTVVASGLDAPRHLTWADDSESIIFFPQCHGTDGILSMLDLKASPPLVRTIAEPTPHDPYSVAVPSPNHILITSQEEVSSVDLTSGVFSATDVLMGIGYVPADAKHLPGGYADTTVDPNYFFQVKNCPFGGTLPIMINWQKARRMSANYYQVTIKGPGGSEIPATQPFSDYLWNVNHFDCVATAPESGSYYKLRSTGQVWLNEWLGMLLDTTGQPNGLNTVTVRLFNAAGGTQLGSFSVDLMIDNTEPLAILEQILQEPGDKVVNACAIVNTGTPTFKFKVTAWAPQSHLRGWDLTAYWGDNKSKWVAGDNYGNNVSLTRLWAGITSTNEPASAWDATVYLDPAKTQKEPTSIHCAHSFFLRAWDRVINGWGYIHGTATYQKSVTLYF